MKIELKPCPFCGGKVVLRKTQMLGDTYFFVMCEGCNRATNVFPFEEQAVKAWDMRADDAINKQCKELGWLNVEKD